MERRPEGLPEELEAVASRLRVARAQGDPLQLAQIKQRVMRTTEPRKSGFMKPRLAAFATIFVLVGGTGGAVAIAGGGDNGNGRGAAYGQYCEGYQREHHPGRKPHYDCGKGDENHGHEQSDRGGNDRGKGHGDHARDARTKKH